MLVVLAIFAATLAISLPFVRGSGDARDLDATAQIIAARLTQVQAAAISTNTESMFKIDLKHAQILEPPYALPAGTALRIETAEGQITSGTAAIRFFADGGSTGGKITLTKGKSNIELAINWLDGAIVISKATGR